MDKYLIFSNLLIVPILAGVISQTAKFFVKSNKYKLDAKHFMKHFMSYSGMPSTHSAIVSSLSATAGLEYGIKSPIFALSLILAVIVIRDALGLRRYLGDHSKVINLLIKELKGEDLVNNRYPRLLEKIGHTNAQVAVGCVLGASISFLGNILL